MVSTARSTQFVLQKGIAVLLTREEETMRAVVLVAGVGFCQWRVELLTSSSEYISDSKEERVKS